MSSPRLVLCPHGQPSHAGPQESWVKLLLGCGADLGRVIDAPSGSITQFARFIGRMPAVTSGRERPLVVLTKTNPLALQIVGARRSLEVVVPVLAEKATWVIFVDPEHDPFFVDTAPRLGELDARLEEAPIWTGPGLMRFLVLSPLISSVDVLADRMAELNRGFLASSTVLDRRKLDSDELGAASSRRR